MQYLSNYLSTKYIQIHDYNENEQCSQDRVLNNLYPTAWKLGMVHTLCNSQGYVKYKGFDRHAELVINSSENKNWRCS